MATPVHKQLVRELKRSPKKAAMLGLLAVVALYFWAPLAFSMFSGKSKKSPSDSKPAAATNLVKNTSPSASDSGDKAPDTTVWRKLKEGLESDERMESEPVLRLSHDPFSPPEPEPETQEQSPVATIDTTVLDKTPASVGLTLTGTLVGARRQVALISGKAYSAGDRVTAADGTKFVVRQVTTRDVVLERDGKLYVLSRSAAHQPAETTDDN